MVEVKLEKRLTIEDLKVGRIFDRTELIIEFDGKAMTTLTHEEGSELKNDHYQEYDMRHYMYDIKIGEEGVVAHINCNGWGEIFLSDENHDEYKSKLEAAGIW